MGRYPPTALSQSRASDSCVATPPFLRGRRLLGVVQPERIILFGSAATGEMTCDSDIDLLVVAASPTNTIEEYGKLHQALRGLGFPFDVFLIATEKFEQTKEIFGGIAYPARKYGRVIYEAA